MLPIADDDEDDEEVDAWNDPSDNHDQLLSKYDDVEDMALKKKRANRIEIGSRQPAVNGRSGEGKTGGGTRPGTTAGAQTFEFTKK